MDYFTLFLALLCITGQFIINKIYQKKFAHRMKDILFFPFVCGIVNIIFFTLLGFIMYGGFPEFSTFSLVMSIILAIVGTLSTVVGILIMKYGRMSVYSVFMMLGGMILPYFYGALDLDETISAARIIGLIVLLCALPLSVLNPSTSVGKNKTSSKLYYALCVVIFFLNGTVSIISKAHSINISAIPASSFIVCVSIWTTVINGIAYFIFSIRFKKSEDHKNSQKSKCHMFYAVIVIVTFATVSGVGSLFQLVSAKTVPAVVLYPFITGGSIVLTTVGARMFFKEKINLTTTAGIIMAVIGTLLFLI